MNRHIPALLLLLALACMPTACTDQAPKPGEAQPATQQPGAPQGAAAHAPATPTNRVDIPAAVRDNLGITFAKAEQRAVGKTLRVPGKFELLPSAMREYRTPVGGRVELLVKPLQRVATGTPLYTVDSSSWRDLMERIAAAEARLESMGPLREAHRAHEKSLAERVKIWEARLAQLEEIKRAGGGSAAQFTEARATLNAAQADLADLMEKDAELNAQQKQVEAELRSLNARKDLLTRTSGCAAGQPGQADPASATFTVCAVADGIVETLAVPLGGLAEENGHVLTVVQPEQIWFRARGPQSDLGLLSAGMPARIVPPQGGSIPAQDVLAGTLQLGPTANPEERTLDLIVRPDALAPWARAGVAGFLEITLKGGTEELAIPMAAVVRDGATPIIFRRDPANPDKAIRMEADLGVQDGRWVVVNSGLKEGDEVVVAGSYQLMLATAGSAPKGGHFHADGTFHEGKD